jgi:polysaccharide chain length determinant protein (PEP-CTERM system associated)
MIPGKKYTPEDILAIGWRRRWLIGLPLVIVPLAAAMYAFTLQTKWMSTALIQIVPQQVPQEFVRSTVTARIEDRLESIQQLILSRTRLEAIIQEFNLYPQARQVGLMEDIVDRMRTQDISMTIVKGDAFKVSFISDNPRLAMRVTERLAGLFIAENLRDRELTAERSSQFLEGELATVRARLEETEKKLMNYRREFNGQLPDQIQTNLQAVMNTQMQVQQLSESINRDRDRRLLVQRQLADLADAPTALPSVSSSSGTDATGAPTGATAADQLEAARAQLRSMQLRFTDQHPDVIRMKRMIGELERKVEQEALQQPLSPVPADTPRANVAADSARRGRMKELSTELASLDRQIATKQTEVDRLRGVSSTYQARVDAAPTRDSELTALTRDYSTHAEQYRTLLIKNQDAKMSANLERRQGGEQFRLLDPARVPERPFWPNRQRIVLMGLAAGLLLGVGVIGLLEYRDSSLRSEEDVMLALALPVLAVIPRMATTSERAHERKRRMQFSAAGALTLMACMLVFVWKFVQWRQYLPW